jgi:hypothetical protein
MEGPRRLYRQGAYYGAGAESDKVKYGSSRLTLVETTDRSDRHKLHLVASPQSNPAVKTSSVSIRKKDIADGFMRLYQNSATLTHVARLCGGWSRHQTSRRLLQTRRNAAGGSRVTRFGISRAADFRP